MRACVWPAAGTGQIKASEKIPDDNTKKTGHEDPIFFAVYKKKFCIILRSVQNPQRHACTAGR